MNLNRRILLIIILMLLGLAIATITNVAFNFRNYAYSSAVEKSKMTAEMVRDGLTAHMINGMMDQRQFFLSNVLKSEGVENIWLVRSPKVNAQYGNGFENERMRDSLDQQVLTTGKMVSFTQEDAKSAMLRISIPYIASDKGKLNCLACHHVNEGDVLGVISMEFDINAMRLDAALSVAKIFAINILFVVIAFWIAEYYLQPYTQLFANLQQGIKQARKGDFSFRFTSVLKNEGNDVAEQMNTLFEKIEETFGNIQKNLGTFMPHSTMPYTNDPLNASSIIIKELSDVYKFKKTIELDTTKEEIYLRFAYVFKEKFHFDHFALYEIDKNAKTRHLVYISDPDRSFCTTKADKDTTECRAYRTHSDIYSSDFMNLCPNCLINTNEEYTCVPFDISNDLALVLSYLGNNSHSIETLNQNLENIKSYFEAAKAVIESRTLTDKLRDSSLRDGATKLYNRHFMDEFIAKTFEGSHKNNNNYAILMIDIDYFKMVNDTYGHDSGDVVIRTLAEILQSNVRKSDLPIRYGGEEFLLFLQNTTQEGSFMVAEKIRTQFAAQKFQFESETVQKTLSIGVSHFPTDSDSIWQMIKFADIALYEAKHTGRNRVVEFKQEMFNNGEKF